MFFGTFNINGIALPGYQIRTKLAVIAIQIKVQVQRLGNGVFRNHPVNRQLQPVLPGVLFAFLPHLACYGMAVLSNMGAYFNFTFGKI